MERQAQGFVIVFDFTRRETFENIAKWTQLLRVHATMEEPPILVLGNKKDMESEIQVTNRDVEEFQERNRGIAFYEVSARSGMHVTEAFVDLCIRMVDIKKSVSGIKLKSNRLSRVVEEV